MTSPDSTPSQPSWRASVPDSTATDLENLLGTGMAAAQEQLERSGGFLPFALVMENDGDVRLVAVSPADPDDGDSELDADVMIATSPSYCASTGTSSAPPPSSAISPWSRSTRTPSTWHPNTATEWFSRRFCRTPPAQRAASGSSATLRRIPMSLSCGRTRPHGAALGPHARCAQPCGCHRTERRFAQVIRLEA